jgi:hypothetical protein
MPEEPKQEVIDGLVGCALSYSAFNIVKDLNTKLSLLQQVNKKYGAISNKLRSGNISDADLDAAVPAAKEKLSSEIERKDDLDLDSDESKKLALISSSKVDQLVNFLKQKRNVQIDMSIVFKEPET